MNKPKLASVVIASLGFLDALYLLMIKLTQEPAFCIQGIGDCWSVNTSKYSEIIGIPVSLLGAGAYLAIILIQVSTKRTKFLQKYGPLSFFGISLTGTIYSAFLTYLEIWVIRAICPFCVISALFMLILLLLSIQNLRKDFD